MGRSPFRGLSDLELTALAARLRSSTVADEIGFARSRLEPGVHEVDFTIRVRGEVRIAPPSREARRFDLPWREICAALLNGTDGVESRRKLLAAFRSVVEASPSAIAMASAELGLDDVEAIARRAHLATFPAGEQNGAVRSGVIVEVVGDDGSPSDRAARSIAHSEIFEDEEEGEISL